MTTGDRYLDDPSFRQPMEDSYNEAPDDVSPGRAGARPPYKAEQGGYCNAAATCSSVTQGNAGEVTLQAPPDGTVLSYHTHQSEGRPVDIPNGRLKAQGKPYDRFGKGASQPDIDNAKDRGVTTYIIRPKMITRIDPDGTPHHYKRFE